MVHTRPLAPPRTSSASTSTNLAVSSHGSLKWPNIPFLKRAAAVTKTSNTTAAVIEAQPLAAAEEEVASSFPTCNDDANNIIDMFLNGENDTNGNTPFPSSSSTSGLVRGRLPSRKNAIRTKVINGR